MNQYLTPTHRDAGLSLTMDKQFVYLTNEAGQTLRAWNRKVSYLAEIHAEADTNLPVGQR